MHLSSYTYTFFTLIFTITGNVISNPESAIELTVFQENYAMLCNTITEIEDLLQYFKAENIITSGEEEDIKNIATNPEKTKAVMLNILTSLEAGNNKFYAMLKVLKNHGFVPTQNLAELITMRLKVSDESSKLSIMYYLFPLILYNNNNFSLPVVWYCFLVNLCSSFSFS